MAKDKKGFILYVDQKGLFDKLPDEVAGKLIKHIYSYVNDENPTTDDILIDIAFESIKTQLKRDLKKYESIRERNRENAHKRWDALKSATVPKDTTVCDRIPKDPKYADSDTDIVTDTDKDNNFNIFWDSYHSITGKSKTDKDPAFKKWKKLNITERKEALSKIKMYFDSLNDKKYCKKARTYLNDKTFNDEFKKVFTEVQKRAFT